MSIKGSVLAFATALMVPLSAHAYDEAKARTYFKALGCPTMSDEKPVCRAAFSMALSLEVGGIKHCADIHTGVTRTEVEATCQMVANRLGIELRN
jgi:hypothetical protein